MLVVPKEKPVLTNLNTYYLKIDKLIEHCQGEIGAGGICFKSAYAQGVVYFDPDEIVNGYFSEKSGELRGESAVERLVQSDSTDNFSVDIYHVPHEDVYFWAGTTAAEKIYRDLSTEFTDLKGLIKKMSAEKLSGYIDILVDNGQDSGLIFFGGGEMVGGSFSWGPVAGDAVRAASGLLIEKTKKAGGVFHVCRIPTTTAQPPVRRAEKPQDRPQDVLRMLEEFLGIFETLHNTQKDQKTDFNSLIRKKFVQNAERFTFLDPFAGEFDFSDRKIRFSGDADESELAEGIIVSTTELAEEIGLRDELRKYMASWQQKYEKKLNHLGVRRA
ncbi:MAG: hypothetical protein WAM73_04780 [Desulfobacterales bacterium]